jgi:hypothetical protein
MSVICRRELMEIEHKSEEQMRDSSGISEIVDRLGIPQRKWQQHWLVAPERRKSSV